MSRLFCRCLKVALLRESHGEARSIILRPQSKVFKRVSQPPTGRTSEQLAIAECHSHLRSETYDTQPARRGFAGTGVSQGPFSKLCLSKHDLMTSHQGSQTTSCENPRTACRATRNESASEFVCDKLETRRSSSKSNANLTSRAWRPATRWPKPHWNLAALQPCECPNGRRLHFLASESARILLMQLSNNKKDPRKLPRDQHVQGHSLQNS